ncbi:MAG: hypothetical protein WA435_14225 [Gallionellaceae bacterium]
MYAKTLGHPAGWKMHLQPHDTGAASVFEVKTGVGLSIQPLYHDAGSPPGLLMWSSLYPSGTLPEVTDDYLRNLESGIQKNLGERYSVSARAFKAGNFDGIELTISKKQVTANSG